MAIKRSASETRLVARPSSYSTSVTLYEATDDKNTVESHDEDTPRRSKRAKRTIQTFEETQETTESSTLSASPESEANQTPKKRKVKKVVPERSSSPKKNKPLRMVLDKPHPAPPRWKEAYDAIKEIRKKYIAPVDTMGCDKAQHNEMDPRAQRLSTLVSLMLSSQTKDEVTDAAVKKLREALGGTYTVEGLIQADDGTISEAISKVGFWRRKTQYIKQAAIRLRDDFNSDVPKTVDELCSLPGVGPKMAFLCLQRAWNINDGIGVDVHVHRITNRLRWHKPPTKTPEETRLNLQSWLPKELHPEINHLLVGFGQTICLPVGPRCDECTLSTSRLCPSAQNVKNSKSRKLLQVRKEVIVEEVEPAAV
ncbi:hypothetical protein ACEPAG_4846 [Sanghuangporus baumii]